MGSSVPPQIPGIPVPQPYLDNLRDIVAGLLGRDGNRRFPGAQPVSFGREHLTELQRNEYFMCEKTDGIRCLLFLYYQTNPDDTFSPVAFLIDRKNQYYDVQPPLRFPHFQFPTDPTKFLFNTILDGELVFDRVQNSPNPRLMFYTFDCLVIDSMSFVMRPLDKRMGYMKERVFRPYDKWRAAHPQQAHNEPFKVKEKELHPPYSLSLMFGKVLPNLPHGNDGLVFTCKGTPYKFGTDEHILKWKPPHENTIDFKLRLGEFPTFNPEDGEEGEIPDYDAMPDRFILLVQHNNNQYQPFQHDLYVTPEEWEILKGLGQRLDGRIIECYRDVQGRWRYKAEDDGSPRWRDDKKDANHISTVLSVLDSIENPVTQEDLIAAEGRIRTAVKAIQQRDREQLLAAMPQPPDAKKRKISAAEGQ
jgi:mRNA guanylyltransferase